ncbi:MAG TPA: type 4a pilus biogenesis protein PilO [Patescibacteria group bacterium]|nr:type 4a pilus biogenesis protein PilO [Patescibacteria group bacterium]
MAKANISTKHLQIDKANATMVISISVAIFIGIFSLFASKSLLSQRSYQAKVITKKEQARDILKKNITASTSLVTAYQSFVGTSSNVLGGNPTGQGVKDGDNAKIVLDALPSQYDFPALAVSLQSLLSQNGVKIGSVTGTDDELNQQKQTVDNTTDPQPVQIPFTASVSGPYASIQNLVSVLEHSIRPINISTISLSGSDSNLSMNITANTYYQPAKGITIKSEVEK